MVSIVHNNNNINDDDDDDYDRCMHKQINYNNFFFFLLFKQTFFNIYQLLGLIVTYPLPVASGLPPSVMATVSVRIWSATTLYAMSILFSSSAPTLPVYGRTVATWR